MRKKHFIDFHKALTSPFILGLMAYTDSFENAAAWIYLSLHGTYTMLWLIKSRVFPDASWEQKTNWGYGFLLLAALSLYWLAPVFIVVNPPSLEDWYVCLCISAYTIGIFFHFASDMQKHLQLRLKPGKLITDGLWSRTRNPNYFGEFMIYLGFISLSKHWAPFSALALMVFAVFIPNMLKKDRSLSRYAEFAAYKSNTKLFIPYII